MSTVPAGITFPVGTTGIGSMPGNDPKATATLIFGEDLTLPFIAELPGRGPGADMVGRTLGVLVGLFADLQPSGWRIVPRPGIDLRRTSDFWGWDLDALQIAAEDYAGPLKLQFCGPWTLSAQVELSNGHAIQTDGGALRDVHASLAEGIAAQVREVKARCPGATIVVQLDEPSLPAVLAGTLPTASGYGRLAPIDEPVVVERSREFIERVGAPVMVHSCAAVPPIKLVHRAGAAGFAGDLALIGQSDFDAIGEALESDFALYLGVFDQSVASAQRIDAAAAQIRKLGTNIGLSEHTMRTQVGLSPSCGLAGFSHDNALVQLRAIKTVAKQVSESL